MYLHTIHTDGAESQIAIGESYRNLSRYLPDGCRTIIVTDANIMKHYGDFVGSYPVIEIGIGETSKTLKTVEHIYDRLLELEADRGCFIAAVGGGIVCDVAGFAASTYMRGIPFGFVSTTLLSQVDASVGGKNGVNFGGYKNMVGTFNQPHFVICDTEMIRTLPSREFVSGFAEIVKASVIRDPDLFDYLEQNADKALARDSKTMEYLVTESVKIKANVVEQDEREHGERRILNFGHTFGHAVEIQTGITHGEAVSVGMMTAARWSAGECGFPKNQVDRLEKLLTKLGLPVIANIDSEKVLSGLAKDKKRENDAVNLVLLRDIGKTEIRKTPMGEIKNKLPLYMR